MAVSAAGSEYKHPYENINGQIDKTNEFYVAKKSTNDKAGQSLDMTDFLTLMVAMFQNQDIDNPADTSTMMTQMVQMSVIQAITDISQLISDSTNMTYGASLIGKEVTIGIYNDTFTDLQEITGVVTGTGQQDGKQVIFIGNDTYLVSDIIAVGRLPEKDDGDKDDDKVDLVKAPTSRKTPAAQRVTRSLKLPAAQRAAVMPETAAQTPSLRNSRRCAQQ